MDRKTKEKIDGIERSSFFSYSSQYFWWKKYNVLKKSLKSILLSNKTKKIKILDIGCQIGHDIFKLSDDFSEYNLDWYGLDIVYDYFEICQLRTKLHSVHNFYFFMGDIKNLPLKKEKFDIIICSEVIEHIDDLGKTFEEFNKVLNEKGKIIISTPNKNNSFLKLIKKFNFLKQKYLNANKKEFRIRKQLFGKDVDEHINVKSYFEWLFIFRKHFDLINSYRGSLIYGAKYVDDNPIIFLGLLFLDLCFDFLKKIFINWSYNFFVILKKR